MLVVEVRSDWPRSLGSPGSAALRMSNYPMVVEDPTSALQ